MNENISSLEKEKNMMHDINVSLRHQNDFLLEEVKKIVSLQKEKGVIPGLNQRITVLKDEKNRMENEKVLPVERENASLNKKLTQLQTESNHMAAANKSILAMEEEKNKVVEINKSLKKQNDILFEEVLLRLGEYSASIHTLNEKISLDIENDRYKVCTRK